MAKKNPKQLTRPNEPKLRRNEIQVSGWRYAFSPIDEYGNPMKVVYMQASLDVKRLYMKKPPMGDVVFSMFKRDMRRLQRFLTRLLDEKRTPTRKKKDKRYDFWAS